MHGKQPSDLLSLSHFFSVEGGGEFLDEGRDQIWEYLGFRTPFPVDLSLNSATAYSLSPIHMFNTSRKIAKHLQLRILNSLESFAIMQGEEHIFRQPQKL